MAERALPPFFYPNEIRRFLRPSAEEPQVGPPPTEKAEELLASRLTEAQRETMLEYGYFDVLSNRGNTWRVYTRRGPSGNITRVGPLGSLGESVCVHIKARYELRAGMEGMSLSTFPQADHFLAQAMLIKCDESRFLSLAGQGLFGFPARIRYPVLPPHYFTQ